MGSLPAGFPVMFLVAYSFLALLQRKDDSGQVSLLCYPFWTLDDECSLGEHI